MLLKDFIFTLGETYREHDRFEIFLTLSGLKILESSSSVKESMVKNRVWNQILSMPRATCFYLETLFQLRRMKGYESWYFLPNSEENKHCLVKAADAEELFARMLRKYGMDEDRLSHGIEKLKAVVESDIYFRIIHSRATRTGETDKNKYVRVDALAKYMLECYGDLCRDKVVLLISALRLSGVSKYDSRKCHENVQFGVSWGLKAVGAGRRFQKPSGPPIVRHPLREVFVAL